MPAASNTPKMVTDNPWKGLNFYHEGEVIYGRDEEIQSLTLYVTNNIQTVLYGKSGIGKSSIINAGVFPLARREGFFPIPIRLKHDLDTSYISQIKAAFIDPALHITEVVPAADRPEETLWEFLHRHTFSDARTGAAVRPLIVLDQFEEIFTLQHNEKKKEAFFSELADLLNEVTPDYIATGNCQPAESPDEGCTQSNSVADAFSLDFGEEDDSQQQTGYVAESLFSIVFTIREDFLSYLERYTKYIPVMKSNRYALLPINEEQAKDIIMKPVEGLVSLSVAKLIIQKVTGRSDFELGDAPEIDVDSAVLSLYLSRLYIKKGADEQTITAELVNQSDKDIIRDFYEESVADLPQAEIEELEDQLLTYDDRRDNVSRGDLIRKGVSADVIRTLAEDRKLLRQFSYQGDLRIEFMHDKLCDIVASRINQRETERAREEERKRLMLKNRKRLIWSLGSTLSLALLYLLWLLLFKINFSDSYAAFTYHNGWPVGIGPTLGSQEKHDMVIHYRLTRRGLLRSFSLPGFSYTNPCYKVELLNRNGKPTGNKLVESPLVSLAEADAQGAVDHQARLFAQKQLATTYWLFTADEKGSMARQTAYDADQHVLYSVQCYHSMTSADGQSEQQSGRSSRTLWMNYVDAEGKSLRVRDNGADRMRVTERNGYYVGYLFFNESGTPQHNSRLAFGYRYEVDEVSKAIRGIIPLDEYGTPQEAMVLRFDSIDCYGRWLRAGNARAEYKADLVVYNMGLRTDSLCYDDDGRQVYRSETIGDSLWLTYAYDAKGHLTDRSRYSFCQGDAPVLVASQSRVYDSATGDLNQLTYYQADANPRYVCEKHQRKGNTHTMCYYSGNHTDSLRPANIGSGLYHKVVETRQHAGKQLLVQRISYALDSLTGIERQLRRVENLYQNGSLLREIEYRDNKRVLSMEYETEDGVRVGQHVVGLTGQPIRCPAWDKLGESYYRKRFVFNFAGDIVAAKAINEFGQESIITFHDREMKISVVPGTEIEKKEANGSIFGIGIFQYADTPASADCKVDYLHITDTMGTCYRAQLTDGCIVLSDDGHTLRVAQPIMPQPSSARTKDAREAKTPRYKVFSATLPAGERGAEIYPVYFTRQEMNQLRESIKTQQ